MDVADLGHQHGSCDQLEAPHRHGRLDGRIVAPLRHLGFQQFVEPLDPVTPLIQSKQILFHNGLVRRHGHREFAQIALVRFAPVGLARVAVAGAQEERFEPLLGPGQVIDGVRAGPGQIADRLVDFV